MRALTLHPEAGEHCVRALLNILVVDAVQFFSVGKSIGTVQALQTVDLIMQDYLHFKPEDFKSCFNRAMKGYYGVIYDRVDGSVMLEWLMKYDNERDAEIESFRAKQNRDLKKTPLALLPTPDELDDVFNSNWEKLQKQLDDNKKQLEAAKAAKAIQRDQVKGPVYQMHQRWLKQFDELWRRQGYPKSRLITRYGKVKNPFYLAGSEKSLPKFIRRTIDVNGYLEHKQWQYNEFVIKGRKPYEVQETSI